VGVLLPIKRRRIRDDRRWRGLVLLLLLLLAVAPVSVLTTGNVLLLLVGGCWSKG
jgi:hypothetical protein